MAIVVNDIRNLPPGIVVGDVKTFETNGIPEAFLKELLGHHKNGVGVERDNYYIITTAALLRFAYPKFTKAFMILRELMDACYIRGFQYIMIKKNV